MKQLGAAPNRLPWPPMIYLVAALGSSFLQSRYPLVPPFVQQPLITYAGAIFAAFGLALDLAAVFTMTRAKTNILPHRAADKLVKHGPFRFTRNPIYVGNTCLLIGLGLWFSNCWLLLAAFCAAVAVDRLAIRREELHLTAKFGAAFTQYQARVPRWLGLPSTRLK